MRARSARKAASSAIQISGSVVSLRMKEIEPIQQAQICQRLRASAWMAGHDARRLLVIGGQSNAVWTGWPGRRRAVEDAEPRPPPVMIEISPQIALVKARRDPGEQGDEQIPEARPPARSAPAAPNPYISRAAEPVSSHGARRRRGSGAGTARRGVADAPRRVSGTAQCMPRHASGASAGRGRSKAAGSRRAVRPSIEHPSLGDWPLIEHHLRT